jgi:membrane protein
MRELTIKVKEIYRVFKRDEVAVLPAYIAFYVLLSFLPLLTIIFETISIISINNIKLLKSLQEALPDNVYQMIYQFILSNKNKEKGIFTFSNIMLVYLSSRIYVSFYESHVIICKCNIKEHFIKDKILSIINTFLMLILILILATFIVLRNYIYDILQLNQIIQSFGILFNYTNIIFSIIIISSILTFLMISLPNFKRKIKEVYAGALFTTIGWILSSVLFKFYVENFGNYQDVYKAFGTIIVFVLWIYLLSYVLVIGIVINQASSNINSH